MFILELKDVVKQDEEHRALDHVSINIPKNCIYGLLGPNGAGKTSLIRIINQITAPDSGTVLLNGEKLKPEDVYNIGYLPEERGLYKKTKVEEQIVHLARLKGLSKTQAKEKAHYWLEKFGIENWKNKHIEELSKGMQQKIQFIITVIHEPPLLILDEPFSGFDPINAEILKKEILELKDKGATVILSTHNMNSVEELCDEITLINSSKVVLQGDVTTIKKDFKKNIYKVIAENNTLPKVNDYYSIIETRKTRIGFEYTIKKTGEISNNKLIEIISQYCEIESFEEILPSMHEIFIESVTKKQP